MSERKKNAPKDGEECYHCGRGGDGNASLIERLNASEAQRTAAFQKLHGVLDKVSRALEANGIRANPDRAERLLLAAVTGLPMRRKDD